MLALDNAQLKAAASSFQIPVKPDLLTELQTLIDVAEPDINTIANTIAKDVGLSSAILKVINSPFYGMSRRISEIKQAAMLLGLTTISGLVQALLLRQAFSGKSSISLERFWDDALDIANAMTFIGNKIKNDIPIDELFTIGLFHDCGIPVLSLKYPDYKDVLIQANDNMENPIRLEEQRYQTNHAILGYFVASSWNLPRDICQLILRHHDFSFIADMNGSKSQLAFSTLKAAENLVEKMKRYRPSPDWHRFSDNALTILGLSEEDYADIEYDFESLFN